MIRYDLICSNGHEFDGWFSNSAAFDKQAATFNQGFATVEYLASALMDMKLHLAGDADIDPDKFERETLAEMGMPKEIPMRHRTPHFMHIFSSDSYSAGYYSYLWSEVLDKDACNAFLETSLFDQGTATSFRQIILEKGGSEEEMTMYVNFRGKESTIEPLLKGRGLN